MANTTGFQWTSSACTHVGMVRDINEDAYLDQPQRGLWVVADGMGGHALGDLASRMVIETLNALPSPESLDQFITDTGDTLKAVNRQLLSEAAIRGLHIIGSTVVVLLAYERRCACLWAGDSRIYLFRNGRLRLLTRDHSEAEELKAQGHLSAEEAASLPSRNAITRAVGAMDELEVDVETMDVNDGDILLLCSDGLSNAVSEQDMRTALVNGDCKQAAEALVDMALIQGGRDNISVIVVRADDPYNSDKTIINPAV